MTRTDLQNLINSNLADLSNIIPSKHREVEIALLNEIAPLYEVKELDIPDTQLATFLTANFDLTGLGINNYVGFAICNGSNGTRNRGGKTSIGYDATDYATIGAIGGEKNHILTVSELPTNNKTVHSFVSGVTSGGGVGAEPWAGAIVNFGGSDAPHNNMQPYIVTLFIQRIA